MMTESSLVYCTIVVPLAITTTNANEDGEMKKKANTEKNSKRSLYRISHCARCSI